MISTQCVTVTVSVITVSQKWLKMDKMWIHKYKIVYFDIQQLHDSALSSWNSAIWLIQQIWHQIWVFRTEFTERQMFIQCHSWGTWVETLGFQQSCKEAQRNDKPPLLFFTQTSARTIVATVQIRRTTVSCNCMQSVTNTQHRWRHGQWRHECHITGRPQHQLLLHSIYTQCHKCSHNHTLPIICVRPQIRSVQQYLHLF